MKVKPRNLTARQRLLLWLCGGAFLAVGIALFVGLVLDALYGYWRTRSEVTTEARLQSVESRRHRVRGGYKTYPIVRYEYQVGSESFAGERIALFKDGGNFSGLLSSAFHSGTPIRVFIDPQHPRFAVINREFSWWPFAGGILFSLAFPAGGVLILKHLARPTTTPNTTQQ